MENAEENTIKKHTKIEIRTVGTLSRFFMFIIEKYNTSYYLVFLECIGINTIKPTQIRKSNLCGFWLKTLKNESFVNFPVGLNWRDVTDDFCKQAGFIPDIKLEGEELSIILNLVNEGVGISFFPK